MAWKQNYDDSDGIVDLKDEKLVCPFSKFAVGSTHLGVKVFSS